MNFDQGGLNSAKLVSSVEVRRNKAAKMIGYGKF